MPWKRNDPDPLAARRRELAEKERQLSEQRARLTEELQGSGSPPPVEVKPEPPVWRLEEDFHHAADPTPARKRNLARQRQRDMILFFVVLLVLLVLLGIFLWVAYVRNTGPNNGA